MTTWAILASGPSMSQAVADAVRDRVKVAAVSDSYRLAPWADLLVSADSKWWRCHPEAAEFQGRKVCAAMSFESLDSRIERMPARLNGCNSGLLACMLAVESGATKLLLCGFDFRSGHFFGDHPAPLKNTTPARYEVFQRQFSGYKPRGVEILNCTPGSGLRAFPMRELDEVLAEPETRGT